MTTSPDESRPSGVSAIVVPDVLRPRIDDFLRSLGCTIEEFPWDGSPVPMVIAVPRSEREERERKSQTIDLGRSTSPVDAEPRIIPDDVAYWHPVSLDPGLRPLSNPHTLPVYRPVQLGNRSNDLTCQRCTHRHFDHKGYAYAPPLGPTRPADIMVVICARPGCSCLTRVEPPTPV